MQAIILAAGMGARLGELGEVTPKALLPLGRGCVLDAVITSIWVDGITTVKVVHNAHRSRVAGDWPKKFKNWVRGVRWSPEEKKRRERPYIRLCNNQISHPDDRRGSVGDLAWGIRENSDRTRPILVVCGDDIYPDPHLPDLLGPDGGKTSAIAVRSEHDLDPLILTANPSKVRVDAGVVAEIGEVDPPWRFCGPFYLAGADVPFVLEYVETWKTAGVCPDSIGDLIDAMVQDGRKVRAVKAPTRFWTVGDKKLYDVIRRRRDPNAGMKRKRRSEGPEQIKQAILREAFANVPAK